MNRKIAVFVISAFIAMVFASCKSAQKQPAAQATPPSPASATAAPPTSNIATVKIETYTAGKQTVTLTRTADGKFTTDIGGRTLSAETGASRELTISEGGKRIASGINEGDKLKLKSPDGSLILELKFKVDKIKVTLDENSTPWELKIKADKIKVDKDAKEYGDIKYKAENGKLKAKNAAKQEMASTKDVPRLSALLSPFLMDGVDQEKRDLLLITLFTLDR